MTELDAIPGEDFLEHAARWATDQVARQMIHEGDPRSALYQASVLGGSAAAWLVLKESGAARLAWKVGSFAKAQRLIQLWSALTALALLSRQSEQEEIRADVSATFSALSDAPVSDLRWLVDSWSAQLDADRTAQEAGRMSTVRLGLLFAAVMEALGERASLRSYHFPMESTREWIKQAASLGLEFPNFAGASPTDHPLMVEAGQLGGRVAAEYLEANKPSP